MFILIMYMVDIDSLEVMTGRVTRKGFIVRATGLVTAFPLVAEARKKVKVAYWERSNATTSLQNRCRRSSSRS